MKRNKPKRILLRKGKEILVVSTADVLFLAAKGFYTEVHFEYSGTKNRLIVCKPISVLCDEWGDPEIMRVHRSYAVHTAKIDAIGRKGRNYWVRIGSHELPVARSNTVLIQSLPAYGKLSPNGCSPSSASI